MKTNKIIITHFHFHIICIVIILFLFFGWLIGSVRSEINILRIEKREEKLMIRLMYKYIKDIHETMKWIDNRKWLLDKMESTTNNKTIMGGRK